MRYLRTPDHCFADLPGYPFEPHYIDVADGEGGSLRVHYVDEGPAEAAPVLMLHGEPSWSYLYRRMIPMFAGAGLRAIAPDLIGFGRSDKPAERSDYSYERHVQWMTSLVIGLDLREITLVCQDWGGMIGLRIVAAHPERFARVVVANTFLPTGEHALPEAFFAWREFSQKVEVFPTGEIIQGATVDDVAADVRAAYDAPYPEESYKEGARAFPLLVPTSSEDPACALNREAWKVLEAWEKPFLCAFSDSDPVTAGGDEVFLRRVPGTKGQAHTTIVGGGHFLQEDQGEQLARVTLELIAATP